MSKLTSLALIVLLFCFTISSTARFQPVFHKATSLENQHDQSAEVQEVEIEESCGGVNNEECLMRRTLAAHLDYIYTQKQKP